MHSERAHFPQNPMLPLVDQLGYHYRMHDAPFVPVFNRTNPPATSVDIQPWEACPRNFIIFDQTSSRSHIRFHPDISPRLYFPGFIGPSISPQNVGEKNNSKDEKKLSSMKEDSADIDALLSSEYEEYDEDEVSTARTSLYKCDSPDSCSNYESTLSCKSRLFFKRSSRSHHSDDKNHHKVRKMVKTLRGIIPGANRMTTVAVLDEAVRYLKSLRVEVQNMGVGNTTG